MGTVYDKFVFRLRMRRASEAKGPAEEREHGRLQERPTRNNEMKSSFLLRIPLLSPHSL